MCFCLRRACAARNPWRDLYLNTVYLNAITVRWCAALWGAALQINTPFLGVKRIGFYLGCLMPIVMASISFNARAASDPYQWAHDSPLVAHALGGIDQAWDGLTTHTYTNCLEALLLNYGRGHRVFETDMTLTSDGGLILLHDWLQVPSLWIPIPANLVGKPMTLTWWLDQKIYSKYMTLGVDNIVDALRRHPDAYLVTDTKVTSGPDVTNAFAMIVASARRINPAVLDRIIPQIYNQPMYDTVRAVYPFKSWIYTLYQSTDTNAEVIDFVKRTGIRVVTIPDFRASAQFLTDLKAINVYTYIHTINSLSLVKNYQSQGGYGFYTDFLLPRDLDYAPRNRTGVGLWPR